MFRMARHLAADTCPLNQVRTARFSLRGVGESVRFRVVVSGRAHVGNVQLNVFVPNEGAPRSESRRCPAPRLILIGESTKNSTQTNLGRLLNRAFGATHVQRHSSGFSNEDHVGERTPRGPESQLFRWTAQHSRSRGWHDLLRCTPGTHTPNISKF